MVTTSPGVKRDVFNTCDATVSTTPFLLSPTSVAHRIPMLAGETERHATGNAIRDQWVANLQNKRMAAAAGTGNPVGSGNRLALSLSGTTTSTTGTSNSRSAFATKSSRNCSAGSRVATAVAHEKSLNSHQRTAHPSRLIVDSQVAMSDADAIPLDESTMLFNEMGGFELESPTLSRLTSSPATITKTSRGWMKRGTKVGSNKRTIHYLALHADQPTSSTPCRKRNCGPAKSDIFDFDYYSMASNDFPDVEAPANISVDASCANTRYLWGPDLDFSGVGGYADTFLDSPTSELVEMPLVPTSQWSHINSSTSSSSKQLQDEEDTASRFDHLQSLNTSSLEQKGFNHLFEPTDLDDTDGCHGDDELFQLATTPLVSVRKSSFSEGSCITSASTECCSDKPASLSSSSWQMLSPSPTSTSSRSDASTARCRLTSCDQKCSPEFETLMGEYDITDIDHELDGFYLDTMEVIENDLG